MRCFIIVAVFALAACGPANPPVGNSVTSPPVAASSVAPEGASIGPEGHATVVTAPPDPDAVRKAADDPHVPDKSVYHFYAAENGLSLEEARRRLDAQQAKMDEVTRLRERLQREEGDNFLDLRLAHQPDWRYIFYFKREPEATLSRYTRDPRFEAASGTLSSDERAALIEPWAERWSSEGIPYAYGLGATRPDLEVSLSITAADYQALAEKNGWPAPPAPIVTHFAKAPTLPAVDPRVEPLLKGYAYGRFATGIQLEALGAGTVTLEDGCLTVGRGEDRKVVVVHQETGISLDEDGYLVFIDRHSGAVRGRIGEPMVWAGPNRTPEQYLVGIERLRARCPGELLNIGNPESAAAFEARYPGATR
ncbi:hypothetical protein [Sphingomicrobium aestuariivivum]|uniref:hypothetical protein n=1 Tax=Sphingomicrobium aestuariivivum TaxID=1582356 RepID=UPI001FD63697|nr:hypothetical protein [Sphingomicrobium aestuariivivum]MCJ8191476.1 hypothetical protein [Sphingomicrobium aestuariivivum]